MGITNVNTFCTRRCWLIHEKFLTTTSRADDLKRAWDDLDEATIGWVAGMIDGEGYFNIGKHNALGNYTLRVGIANTYKPVIDFLHSIFPHSHVFTDKRPGRPNWKLKHSWFYTSGQVVIFAQLILPYLRIKRQQAALVGNITVTNLQNVDADVAHMKALNQRGVHTRSKPLPKSA